MHDSAQDQKGRLRVARLTVRNVLGVEDSVIDLDTITVLSGANASGKSSHLKALRSALGIDRTALARLARVNEDRKPGEPEEPSVEVLLVDDTGERELLVSRKGEGSPEVRERVGEDWRKVPRPVEYLRQLVDIQAASPAAWLAMDDEAKAAAVLEAMPLPAYSRAAALQAAGLEGFRLPPIPAGLHPLEDLEQIEAAVFSSRTEVNRQERAEHDAAEKLLGGLPAERPEAEGGRVAHLEEEATQLSGEIARTEASVVSAEKAAIAAADAEYQLAQERVAGDFKVAAAKLRAAHEAQVAQLRRELEERIAALKIETDRAVEELKARGETTLDEAEGKANAAKAAATRTRERARERTQLQQEQLSAMREELAAVRERQRAIETDHHVRKTAEEGKARARACEAKAQQLTEAIAALRRYRLQLAEQLPIKGLSVHFDEKGRKSLTLDGVPLSQVNDGRLYELAAEVSLVRHAPAAGDDPSRPRLNLVLLDGIERLDPERRAGMLREIARRGSQVIAACVTAAAWRVLRGDDALAA